MSQISVSLLGGTGSIGDSTLSVLRRYPEKFHLESMAAGRQWRKVLPLIEEFGLHKVCIFEESAANELRKELGPKSPTQVLSGMDGLLDLVRDASVDFVLNGLLGSIGCKPTLEAIAQGKRVGLANKETMVMAGPLINQALRENSSAALIPIDSEHSAIFQCLAGRPTTEVEEIQLTASGGPFREWPRENFASITKAQALKHPTWVMGQKITIDSASLMNKGLEVIEAHYLFDIPVDNIRVVIHPSSIVHSFVQFRDGSLMAQLGCPDMRLPIQYALTFPERWPLAVDRVDLTEVGKLEFFPPDFEKFPCLKLAFAAGRTGGTAPAILNAANEVAVAAFLAGTLSFNGIPETLLRVLDEVAVVAIPTLEDVLDADRAARQSATTLIEKRTVSHV